MPRLSWQADRHGDGQSHGQKRGKLGASGFSGTVRPGDGRVVAGTEREGDGRLSCFCTSAIWVVRSFSWSL